MNNSIFTGRRRRGKTTRAFSLALQHASVVVVFDPKREFQNWPGTCTSVQQVMDSFERGERVIVFHPENVDTDFTALASFVWAIHEFGMDHGWQVDRDHKPMAFIVDESHLVQSPWIINPMLKKIMQQARPEILAILQTTQSPAYLYSASKIANSEYYFFYTSHVADLKRIEQIAGPEIAAMVKDLKDKREYIWYSEDDQTFERVTDSDSWRQELIYKEKEHDNVSKQRIEVDDDFLDELAERVGKVLSKSGDKKKKKNGEDDDDRDSGFVLSFGKTKKEED